MHSAPSGLRRRRSEVRILSGVPPISSVSNASSYDPDVWVYLDPGLTRSAIQNLVDNATKYTDSGEVDVTAEVECGHLVIHVRDNCAGISNEELATIFEPFKRGTSGKSGTGLGLAIARRAAEAQRGSIVAESATGHGCHFWLTLPVQKKAD